jgi:hypothetical protein
VARNPATPALSRLFLLHSDRTDASTSVDAEPVAPAPRLAAAIEARAGRRLLLLKNPVMQNAELVLLSSDRLGTGA